MQICLTLAGVQFSFDDHSLEHSVDEKKKRVLELLKNPGLINFLINYIKEMKNETLHILLSHETTLLLETFKVQPNEIHKLSEE